MRKVLLVIGIGILALSGCSKPIPPVETGTQKPPDNVTWISPGKVQIGNFYPGARAEWNITLHNGNDAIPRKEAKIVTTEIGETEASIPIKNPLLANSTKSITITSDQEEKLSITSYDSSTKSICVTGFKPDFTRILTVEYSSATEFKVQTHQSSRVSKDRPMVDAQDWVIIADPTPVLQPRETRDILIAIELPKGVKSLPQKWEFWISAVEQGQGMIQTELVSRWLVDMR